jgi:hypothetical protein
VFNSGVVVGVVSGVVVESGTVFDSGIVGDVCCPSIFCIGIKVKLVEINRQEKESTNFIFIDKITFVFNCIYTTITNGNKLGFKKIILHNSAQLH